MAFSDVIPGLASYYDLLHRLWFAVELKKTKLRKFERKPSKHYKANQKLPNRKPGVVSRLIKALEKDSLPDIRPERILQEILKHAVVETSEKLGPLGDTNAMSIAGDGNPYYSGASSYGIKVCECKSQGIFNCQCPRRYSDPDAT